MVQTLIVLRCDWFAAHAVRWKPMKPKINRKGETGKSNKYDQCQTPEYALTPLLSALTTDKGIWESAAGEYQFITNFLYKKGFYVISTDLLYSNHYDFFSYEPEEWDIQVTNPPYSIKFQWLKRSYALNKPFALLLPVETIGAKRAQTLFEKHGVQIIFMDKRVDFHMPEKGWDGRGAQFPTAWFTWGLKLPNDINYAKLNKPSKRKVKQNVSQ